MRVVQTPNSRRFVGEASFAALSGAPVLVSEFERDPARGAFPGEAIAGARAAQPPELVANADVYLIAPASANTIAKLAAGLADNLLSELRARRDLPAGGRAGDEQPHVRARGDAGQLQTLRERGVQIVEPGVGRLPRRASRASGAWPSRQSCWRRARRR